MKVYIIFDNAGIWTGGKAVYATKEAALKVIGQRLRDTAFGKTSFGDKTYRLQWQEFEVQE